MGVLFQHPTADNIECPNIAKIGGKWVLLVSVFGRVEWFAGKIDLKTLKLTADHTGNLADGSYASQLVKDKNGRTVHLAWINTGGHPIQGKTGWNGCFSLPARLSLTKEGLVARTPVTALKTLRTRTFRRKDQELDGSLSLTGKVPGDRLEIEAEVVAAGGVRLDFPGGSMHFDASAGTVSLPGRAPVKLGLGRTLKFRLFVDGAIVEAYFNDGTATLTTVVDPGQSKECTLAAFGGPAQLRSLAVHALRPAKMDLTRFR